MVKSSKTDVRNGGPSTQGPPTPFPGPPKCAPQRAPTTASFFAVRGGWRTLSSTACTPWCAAMHGLDPGCPRFGVLLMPRDPFGSHEALGHYHFSTCQNYVPREPFLTWCGVCEPQGMPHRSVLTSNPNSLQLHELNLLIRGSSGGLHLKS